MSQGRQIPTRPWRRGRRRRRRLREPLEEVRGSAIPSFSGGHVRPCLFVSLDPFSWHPPSIRLRQPPRVDPRRPVGARRRDRSPAAAARATVVRGGSAFSLCRSLCDRLDDPFATASTIASRGMLGRAASRAPFATASTIPLRPPRRSPLGGCSAARRVGPKPDETTARRCACNACHAAGVCFRPRPPSLSVVDRLEGSSAARRVARPRGESGRRERDRCATLRVQARPAGGVCSRLREPLLSGCAAAPSPLSRWRSDQFPHAGLDGCARIDRESSDARPRR